MSLVQTAVQQPVKGLRWQHSRRTYYDGTPAVFEVSSVRPLRGVQTVYSREVSVSGTYTTGETIKTPLAAWERWCERVLSVPEAPAADPTISASEAKALFQRAHEAGLAAGEAVRTSVMAVGSPTTPLGSVLDWSKPVEVVMDGPCGFAYLNVPGNTPLGRYAKTLGWSKAYRGGLFTGVRPFGQSYERKAAYAAAWVSVVREAGHRASYETRLD